MRDQNEGDGAGSAAAAAAGPAAPPRTLLAGYGEVGRAVAARLAERGAPFLVVDPARAGEEVPGAGPAAAALPEDLGAFDLVLAVTPASVASGLAAEVARRPGGILHVDLSSAAPGAMAEAAALFSAPAAFVDGAIMGSVDLNGADTPIILAGSEAARAAGMLERLGLPATALADSRPGDAAALKLLRSVVTKGIEAVAVEAYVAAHRLGLADALRANLDDISRRPFPDFLDAIVRTHPVHAARRAREVEAAIGELGAHALPTDVSRAVLARFETTAGRLAADPPPQRLTARPSAREAAAWLAGDER